MGRGGEEGRQIERTDESRWISIAVNVLGIEFCGYGGSEGGIIRRISDGGWQSIRVVTFWWSGYVDAEG